jgi:hypothetical protein
LVFWTEIIASPKAFDETALGANARKEYIRELLPKMKKNIQIGILLLAGGLAVAQEKPANHLSHSGEEWTEEVTGEITAARMVKVKTYAGPIRIQGGPQKNITYTLRKHVQAGSEKAARRELQRMQVAASTEGGVAMIRGECSDSGSIELEIHVPRKTALVRLESSGGPIMAGNIAGKVEAHTGGDTIQLDQIDSDVFATTGGGNIVIGKIGGEIRVETGGGDIRIDAGEAMKLTTGAGSIHVNKCNGRLNASTGGGAIDLKEVTGRVQIASGGGSIRLGPTWGGVQAATGGGPIMVDLAAQRGAFTASRLETTAGDIVVYIPDDLGVTIQAAVELAHGFGINSDFPDLKIMRGNAQWRPRDVRAEGKLNGGGPLLIVHTTNGNIDFRRRAKK